MPLEEIARLAALHGVPVEHFADHSIVHTPDGPMHVAHVAPLSSHPSAVLPPRVGATSGARPPTQHIVFADDPGGGPIPGGDALRTVRHLDDLRAQAEEGARQERIRGFEAEEAAQLARLEAGGRLPDEEHARDVEYVNARAPQVGADGALPPDVQRALDADRETIAQRGELSGLRGSGALRRAELAHGVAPRPARPGEPISSGGGVTSAPDGTQIDTATGQPIAAPPPGVPASWLRDPAAGLREGARSAIAADQAMRTPAPVTSASLPTIPGVAPTGQEQAPVAPQGAPTRGPGGASRPQPAPMTIPQALDQVAGTPQARGAFDQTIAGLAGDYAGPRRDPDLIDRQTMLEQQRAGLAERAAQTQAQIEQQVEQERQQHEADRQHAMASAQQRYQNAIDRVASMHLDPSHYFRDGGNAVGSVIAVALGALGQAFTGSSTNDALAMVNQAIERDLDAQRSEIDSARAGADMQGNMIDIMRGEFGDRSAADAAAHSAMLQQAALHVQEMEAGLQGQEALNNADALRQQLEAASQEARQQAEDRQATLDLHRAQTLRELARAQQEAIRADRMGHGGGRPPRVSASQLADFDAIMRANPEISREHGAALAGLPDGFVPSQASTADTQHQRAPLDAALRDLEAGIPAEGDIPGVGMLDSRAPAWLLSDAGQNVRRRALRTLVRMLRMDSGANVPPAEVEQYAAMYGLNEGTTESQFRQGMADMRRDFDAGLLGMPQTGDQATHDHAEVGFTPD